jgi:DNA (cytosine-5)-methyltransferase 1
MRAAECFAGCGGTTCGLVSAGFDVRLGIDHDAAALAVLRANHGHTTLQMDLGDVECAVRAIREVGPIELLCGSPPCTDFSSAGRRVERAGVAGLTAAFARIAVALHVRCVWIENVPEMLHSSAWEAARETLVSAGYSIVVLRVNSAACEVPQVRRRVFVLATLGCDGSVLRRVEQSAASYNKTPADAKTVRSCLDEPSAHTYWYNARSSHSPCVRSADAPAPTLRCNCLAPPPAHYEARHDDAGGIANAHVLNVSEMARVASFPPNYLNSCTRTAAGRMIGNCVPPAMAAVVAGWAQELLCAPVSAVERPICLVTMRRHAQRISRLHRLVDLGLLDKGASLNDGTLIYMGGASATGDAIVQRVLGDVGAGWRIELRPRRTPSVSNGHAPLDDLYIRVDGHVQPFRSIRQLQRSFAQHANAAQ